MPDGLLSSRLFIDRLQRQCDFDQFLLHVFRENPTPSAFATIFTAVRAGAIFAEHGLVLSESRQDYIDVS